MSQVKLGLVVQGQELFAVHANEAGEVESSQFLCEVDRIDHLIEALEQVKALCVKQQTKPAGAVLH